MTYLKVDEERHYAARRALVLGIAVFVSALATEVTKDSTWGQILSPGHLLPALGQIAGFVLAVSGAKNMLPKEK